MSTCSEPCRAPPCSRVTRSGPSSQGFRIRSLPTSPPHPAAFSAPCQLLLRHTYLFHNPQLLKLVLLPEHSLSLLSDKKTQEVPPKPSLLPPNPHGGNFAFSGSPVAVPLLSHMELSWSVYLPSSVTFSAAVTCPVRCLTCMEQILLRSGFLNLCP